MARWIRDPGPQRASVTFFRILYSQFVDMPPQNFANGVKHLGIGQYITVYTWTSKSNCWEMRLKLTSCPSSFVVLRPYHEGQRTAFKTTACLWAGLWLPKNP